MSEFLYILRPFRPGMASTPTEEETRIVQAHFEYLQRAVSARHAIFVGRTTDDDPVGLCVFEAGGCGEAARFMRGDPAVAGGLMTAELHPFHVALMRGRDGT